MDGEAGAAEYSLERPFASLLSTTRDVLLSPRRFFDDLAPDGPLWPPVIYFLICHLATTLINLVATAAIFAVPAVFLALADPKKMTPVVPIVLGVFVLVYLAFSALVAVLFFASVLLQHAFVLLAAGREQRGLRATLRLSCYAVGAPIALGWVPVVGLLAVFYCFYLYATALKRVHGISTGTTLGAVLVPLALALALAALFVFFVYRGAQDADLASRIEVPEEKLHLASLG